MNVTWYQNGSTGAKSESVTAANFSFLAEVVGLHNIGKILPDFERLTLFMRDGVDFEDD